MAEWDDVRRIALALPETSERPAYGNTAWRVRDKIFVWERPLRPKEVREIGERAPAGPILAARVEGLDVKEALLQDDPVAFFTTPHFDGYAAVLIRLDRVSPEELNELITEAWLCRAPKRLAKEYLENEGGGPLLPPMS
jgi:hypothetical protein